VPSANCEVCNCHREVETNGARHRRSSAARRRRRGQGQDRPRASPSTCFTRTHTHATLLHRAHIVNQGDAASAPPPPTPLPLLACGLGRQGLAMPEANAGALAQAEQRKKAGRSVPERGKVASYLFSAARCWCHRQRSYGTTDWIRMRPLRILASAGKDGFGF
jgi:hypothetical protein